jgi:hypothetical protein
LVTGSGVIGFFFGFPKEYRCPPLESMMSSRVGRF